MGKEQAKALKKRGIYLLPNLLTSANLFAGFFAIITAMRGHFDSAAIAVFVAMIADSLDGRVARLMQANTAFGVQYDSLADMVSFGIAPSIIIYSWSLVSLGKFGWLAAFCYTASVALRLARFNIQDEHADPRYFKGLSSPLGAAIMVSFAWLLNGYVSISPGFAITSALITLLIAGLMVSNIRYRSFKEIDFKGRQPFFSMLIVILTFVAISIDPPLILFTLFVLYGLSGPFFTLYRVRQIAVLRRKRKTLKKNRSINGKSDSTGA